MSTHVLVAVLYDCHCNEAPCVKLLAVYNAEPLVQIESLLLVITGTAGVDAGVTTTVS